MKKLVITEAQYNRLKENLIKETAFSWDGTYANEVNEHHDGEFSETLMNKTLSEFLDELKSKNEESYEAVEEIIKKNFNQVQNEACGCPLNQPEPTDVQDSQWFSDVDGERIMDNQVD